jgi:hypothetical protein
LALTRDDVAIGVDDEASDAPAPASGQAAGTASSP